MVRIALRLLVSLFLIFYLIVFVLSALTGVNIYRKYKKQLLISVAGFIRFVVALYIVFAMLGLGN